MRNALSRTMAVLTVLALAASAASAQAGGGYDLTWSKIACGGSTDGSTGGVYVVGGTVGQIDAEPDTLYSGDFYYRLVGGFWAAALPCPADINGDGFVDGIDADLFNNAFAIGDPLADFNGDGFVDGIDADEFNNAFAKGC